MAESRFQTTQYEAEHFVESAGAILFQRSTRKICLTNHQNKDEWLLAKGRRNVGENLQQTAIREVTEETGLPCRLLPITLSTRAPPGVEERHYADEARVHTDVCEPFMVTCRQLDEGRNLKIIMWYIAELDETAERMEGEDTFRTAFFDFEEALQRLTFQGDRDVVRKAIEIFEQSYGS